MEPGATVPGFANEPLTITAERPARATSIKLELLTPPTVMTSGSAPCTPVVGTVKLIWYDPGMTNAAARTLAETPPTVSVGAGKTELTPENTPVGVAGLVAPRPTAYAVN